VYTRTLPSLQFLKTSLSWDLGLKCCNQPSPPIQLPQFILKIGRQPLQDMFKTNNQPLQFMLGEKLQSPMIHTNITSSTTVIHVGESSPTFVHHVGDEPLSSTNQAESMSPAIMNNVGAIHMIEKPPSIGNNPKFLCRLCKWCHLTLLCPNIVVVKEVQSFSDNPLGSDSFLVSQQSISSLNNTSVMMMKYSLDAMHFLSHKESFFNVINISSLYLLNKSEF
jgi:hypothetical protein